MTDSNPAAFAAGIYQNVPELDYHSVRFGPHGSVSSKSPRTPGTPPRQTDRLERHPAMTNNDPMTVTLELTLEDLV